MVARPGRRPSERGREHTLFPVVVHQNSHFGSKLNSGVVSRQAGSQLRDSSRPAGLRLARSRGAGCSQLKLERTDSPTSHSGARNGLAECPPHFLCGSARLRGGRLAGTFHGVGCPPGGLRRRSGSAASAGFHASRRFSCRSRGARSHFSFGGIHQLGCAAHGAPESRANCGRYVGQ